MINIRKIIKILTLRSQKTREIKFTKLIFGPWLGHDLDFQGKVLGIINFWAKAFLFVTDKFIFKF